MAKYTSDTNLIRGAAAVGQSMMPTDLSGLDKITKAGTDMMDKASKDVEAEIKERDELKKKFDDSSEAVLLRSGALGGKLYESAIADTKKLRELYIDGVNTRDEKKKMDAMVGLQNLSIFVQDHKQTNLDIADLRSKGDLSSYYEKNAKGREKAKIITQILNQDYSSVSTNEEGDKVFHVKGLDGKEIKVSSKEYREMSSTLKPNLPKTKNEWDAAGYDDISGTNLEEMLNSSETLDQEILMSVDPKAWDTDPEGKAGVLDPSEKAAFIDAVLNTENDFFNLGVSNQILEDQLTNAGRNSHGKHWLDINNKKQEILDRQADANKRDGRNLPYGFRTWGQMKEDYDLIQNTAVGDTYNAPTGHIFTRQENMTYLGPDGKTYTPNQLKRFIKIDHLGDFAEPADGYGNNEDSGGGGGVEVTPVTEILQHGGDEAKMYNMNTMLGDKTFSELFDGSIDDDDVAEMLQTAFPNLKVTAPFNVKEKIRINTREFNVKNKSDMAKLLEYLNSPKIQKSISPEANTEFNSTTP